jgi:uncharacterized membrane protein
MKKYFITGLVFLLPVAVTILILVFVVDFMTKPFMGMATAFLESAGVNKIGIGFLSSEQVLRYGSQILIIVGLFVITLFLGILARWFFFNAIINLSDKILHKIPLVNKVYKTTQDIIKTLFVTDRDSFKQVVMAPFPSKGMYSLGLVSRESPETCRESTKSDLISVFVPTTPNPTTGFLLMFKKEDLIYLDIKTEDAVKYIVSCGVIIPPQKHEKGEI